jgi:pullulanase
MMWLKRVVAFVCIHCFAMIACAQEPGQLAFLPEQQARGYAQREGTTYFLYATDLYGTREPERVVVTGAFRAWSQDMDDAAWQLKPSPTQPNLWWLAIKNEGYQKIPASSPFKFRTDRGEWMAPPAKADNAEGGNLVFEPGVVPVRIKASIVDSNSISVRWYGDAGKQSANLTDYQLKNAVGDSLRLAQIRRIANDELILKPKDTLDVKRVYYLEVPKQKLRSLCWRDSWFSHLKSQKVLGAEVSQDNKSTSFRIFAPRATAVRLFLYRGADDSPEQALARIDMQQDEDGVWESIQSQDMHGLYYDFTVHGPNDPGNFFYETNPTHVTDPYARVSLDSFGKCRVWKKTKPAAPLAKGRPKMQDVIAYEVHVQDFSVGLPVEPRLKGTFAGMMATGLKNSRGEPIGFDYLSQLGINVVHLMPVQEFLHYPDSQWQTAFRDDPFMQKHGVHLENYDWGYRTTHAFAIESRFRTKGSANGEERDQFRDLVQAFHQRGIAVIVDLVPNHTGENMDGRNYLFNFNAIDLPYYYRTNDNVKHIGPYGNEIKTENRPMVQRWLIDQCKSLIEEIGIDGFRIDLAGQLDKRTLKRLRSELGDDIIIYGEPWIAPSDPEVAKDPELGWYKKDAPITFFQDDARNAFKGPTSNPVDKVTSRGFAGGDTTQRERAMAGLLNSFPDEATPNSGINYLDIHDNWALADQFATKEWDGRLGVDQPPFRIAAGLLFTSLGPIVIHGGTEIMRSKGSAELAETSKMMEGGALQFHGKSDTYNMLTPNLFQWEDVGGRGEPTNGFNDYDAMLRYWKGLIAFRNSEFGAVFRVGEVPREGYYRWILPEDKHLLGYVVDDRVLVLVNTSDQLATFDRVVLPQGRWLQISDGKNIELERIDKTGIGLEGGEPISIPIPAESLMIWVLPKR